MNKQNKGGFPDPFAPIVDKLSRGYFLKYAKAIQAQWGNIDSTSSLFGKRNREFEINRDYANGTQDTSIYKQLITGKDPNGGDGSLMNLDWSPVPIIPKFVRVVENRILSRKPYPSVEAIDPVSRAERENKKNEVNAAIKNKPMLQEAKQLGLATNLDPDMLPDTTEEAQIMGEGSFKTNAEIAAQVATNLTLEWNDFNDRVYRRAVHDLVVLGMGVVKRENDPNYGINEKYVDPRRFVHSYTEDPLMSDLSYAGHIESITIQELKRRAGDQFTEEDYKKLAESVKNKSMNDASNFGSMNTTKSGRVQHGYDDYFIDVMPFEFISVDPIHYELKESRFGNEGFYHKGMEYSTPAESVFNREPHKMYVQNVMGATIVVGTDMIFDYGVKKNIPKNVHDLTRARLSYSVACTNLRDMMPKSMVSSIKGYADQLQLSHLKIQHAVAKAMPSGFIIDVEGLEGVTLGDGGELSPLDIADIAMQTGNLFWRSRNEDGSGSAAPIRELNNTVKNINEFIGLYNHYLRMIRDTTGVNEAMDASTPKGDALVGVQQQAIAAGNNALYDITHASQVLYKRVCDDVVKCLQILPTESVLYRVYEKAIGEHAMNLLSSFRDLHMYNFGVLVMQEMSMEDKMMLEQNINQSLAQQAINLEDAIAVRKCKDIEQAEKLLIIRRNANMKKAQEAQAQQQQMQAQLAQQQQQAAAQMRMQESQLQAQVKGQLIQMQGQVDMQIAQIRGQFELQKEELRAQATLGFREEDQAFKEKLKVLEEDRKDKRIDKQAVKQSQLISQRKDQRGEMKDQQDINPDDFIQGLV